NQTARHGRPKSHPGSSPTPRRRPHLRAVTDRHIPIQQTRPTPPQTITQSTDVNTPRETATVKPNTPDTTPHPTAPTPPSTPPTPGRPPPPPAPPGPPGHGRRPATLSADDPPQPQGSPGL